MTETAQRAIDYRELMKQVEALVGGLEPGDDVARGVLRLAREVIARFRDELGLYGGRLYRREGPMFVLEATFGDAKPVAPGLAVPRSYGPIDACLANGVVYVEPGDPGVDLALERDLGVEEFACLEVGDGELILAFNIGPAVSREDVVFSLQILRGAITQRLRDEWVQSLFLEARRIQASILPRRPPAFAPFDIAGRMESMETVGGDFYDWIPLTDKILGLAIADVSGHGLPAALQVRDVRMGLRMGMARDFKIVRTVERLNEIIHNSTLTSRFVALFYGELEKNGTFIYVNAGHVAPFHLRRDGSYQLLTEGGVVLGPLSDSTYERGFVQMGPGDLLVLATDGIGETLDPTGEELGFERLLAIAREHRHRTAKEVTDAIFAAVEAYAQGQPPQDDRTVLVVKVTE